MFQAQIAKKIRTFSPGSASAKKLDVLIEKKSVHLPTLVEPKFSSFSPPNFTDHHSAYYLALEKNKGTLGRKMNH